MIQARLQIWIKGKPVLQGKVYEIDKKPVFLANIDDNKLWHNYNGYSIANQILETFQSLKLRPLILYKHIKSDLIYQAVPSDFYKLGIEVNYGNHRQMVLPVNKWKFFKGELNEPFDIPAMTVDEWKKRMSNSSPAKLEIPLGVYDMLKQMNPEIVAKLREL